MIVRVRLFSSRSFSGWGGSSLAFALSALLYASCTTSEDTEPYVPAVDGAIQPEASGALISEDDACDRLKSAAEKAYDRLDCEPPTFQDCPAFLRPGGGSGCYEYREGSIEACEDKYAEASSCRTLSPCFATAELNLELATCEQVPVGEGGAGGGAAGGAGPTAGAAGDAAQGGTPGAGGEPAAQGGNAAGGLGGAGN